MLNKFLKDVFGSIAGKQAEDLVDLLDTKKHVNEFIIAKKLDLTINQTRNILYKISDHGLVSSIRKKDKKKGWYTYFWKIETLKALEFLRDSLNKKIGNYEHQLKSRETKRFYVCERCHIELSEENALLYDFTCNECGSVLTLKDNTKLINEMRRNLDKLRKDLMLVNDEVEKEERLMEKQIDKERKKYEKEREAVLKKKRLEREKLRKKAKREVPAKKKASSKVKKKTRKVVKKKVKKVFKKKTTRKRSRK